MSDQDVFALLLDMGYPELCDKFTEKQITTYSKLRDLSYTEVKSLVPDNQVENFWSSHRNFFSKKNQDVVPKNASSSVSADLGSNESNSTRSPLQEVNKNKPVNKIFVTDNVNVHQILDDTYEGRAILNWYSSKRKLTPPKRKKVVHLVMCAILRLCEREFTPNDYKTIASKIVEVFPTELACVYYSPYVSKNHSSTGLSIKPAGKLLHKYNNLKRLPVGVYQSEQECAVDNVNDSADEDLTEQEKASIDWLRTLEEPWDLAKHHWKKTYKYRHPVDEERNKLVHSIFETWTILKCCKSFELIGIDFDLSHICEVKEPMKNFSDFYTKISQVRTTPNDDICNSLKSLLEEEYLNEDSKIFIQLMLLSFMLPSTARIPQGKRKVWKPTCLESFDGMITHVKIYGDLQKTKEDRQTFAKTKNIRLQPYIIVVGEGDFEVESSYLIIDDVEYELTSLQEAIDYCFKSFHVLCAEYQKQSRHLWLLLQHGVYRFRTKWDPLELSVDEVLNDIRFVLPPLNSTTS